MVEKGELRYGRLMEVWAIIMVVIFIWMGLFVPELGVILIFIWLASVVPRMITEPGLPKSDAEEEDSDEA